jgi:hypothetical protein
MEKKRFFASKHPEPELTEPHRADKLGLALGFL